MKAITMVLVSVLGVGGAMAQSEPLQLSLTPNVASVDRNVRIEGLTLNVWGENPQSALALGVVNGSTGSSAGISLGLILNYADNYKGLQWALVNNTEGDMLGWQGGFLCGLAISFVNYTGGSMKGLQTGVVNYAGNLSGLQVGVLNYAETAAAGAQIGLVNIIPANRWFTNLPGELAPGMVFVNWRF